MCCFGGSSFALPFLPDLLTPPFPPSLFLFGKTGATEVQISDETEEKVDKERQGTKRFSCSHPRVGCSLTGIEVYSSRSEFYELASYLHPAAWNLERFQGKEPTADCACSMRLGRASPVSWSFGCVDMGNQSPTYLALSTAPCLA